MKVSAPSSEERFRINPEARQKISQGVISTLRTDLPKMTLQQFRMQMSLSRGALYELTFRNSGLQRCI